MTAGRRSVPTARRPACAGSSRRLGDWVLSRSPKRPFGWRRRTYIERGRERVSLEHCSGLLDEFLSALGRIETEFARRYGSVTSRTVGP